MATRRKPVSPKGILKKTSSSPRLTGLGKGVRVRVNESAQVCGDMRKHSTSPLPVPSQLKKLLAMTQGQSTSLKTLSLPVKKPTHKIPQVSMRMKGTEPTLQNRRTLGTDLDSEFLLLQAVTRQLGLPIEQYQLVPTSASTSVPTSIVIPSPDGYQVYALRQ